MVAMTFHSVSSSRGHSFTSTVSPITTTTCSQGVCVCVCVCVCVRESDWQIYGCSGGGGTSSNQVKFGTYTFEPYTLEWQVSQTVHSNSMFVHLCLYLQHRSPTKHTSLTRHSVTERERDSHSDYYSFNINPPTAHQFWTCVYYTFHNALIPIVQS